MTRFGVSTGVISGELDPVFLEPFEPELVEIYARTRAEVDAIHRWAKTSRISLSLHVPTPLNDRTLIAAGFDPTGCEVAVERAARLVRMTLQAAEDLDASHVVVHVPGPTSHGSTSRAVSDRASEFLLQCLAERGSSSKVRLLVENVSSNRHFGSPEEYATLLDAVPGIGFCLDIGHAEDLQPHAGVDDFIDVLGTAISAAHVYWPTDREGGRTIGKEGSSQRRRVVGALRRLGALNSPLDAVLELRTLDPAHVDVVAQAWRSTRDEIEAADSR